MTRRQAGPLHRMMLVSMPQAQLADWKMVAAPPTQSAQREQPMVIRSQSPEAAIATPASVERTVFAMRRGDSDFQ